MAMLRSALMTSLFNLMIAVALVNGQEASTTGDSSTSAALSTSIVSTTTTTSISSPQSTLNQLLSSTSPVILPSSSSSIDMSTSSAMSSATSSATSSAQSSPTSTVSTASTTSTVVVLPSSASTSRPTSRATSEGLGISTTVVTSRVPTSPSEKFVPVYADQSVAEYARIVAAVCAGCGLLILTLIFMVVVSLLLRHTIRTERHKSAKPGKTLGGGNVGFYSAGGQQSHQALFSNLSATNIVGGYSDLHLDAKDGRGVYLNRGYDSSAELHNISGSGEGSGYDSSYRPIEIKSSQAEQRQSVV